MTIYAREKSVEPIPFKFLYFTLVTKKKNIQIGIKSNFPNEKSNKQTYKKIKVGAFDLSKYEGKKFPVRNISRKLIE